MAWLIFTGFFTILAVLLFPTVRNLLILILFFLSFLPILFSDNSPEFDVTSLKGVRLSSSNLAGKVVFIHFWVTWLRDSRREVLFLKSQLDGFDTTNFIIIGVSLDKNLPRLKSYLQREKIVWEQFADGRGFSNYLATLFSVSSVPSNLLIGRDGKIYQRNIPLSRLSRAVKSCLSTPWKSRHSMQQEVTSLLQMKQIKRKLKEDPHSGVTLQERVLPQSKKSAISHSPSATADKYVQLLKTSNDRGRYSETVKLGLTFLSELKNKGESALLCYQLGIGYFYLGQFGSSRKMFARAMRSDVNLRENCMSWLIQMDEMDAGVGYFR